MSKRITGWTAFLDKLEGPEVDLRPWQAEQVRIICQQMRDSLGSSLALPRATAGKQGQIKLAWNLPDKYAEIEVFPNGSNKWSCRERLLDEEYSSGMGDSGSYPIYSLMDIDEMKASDCYFYVGVGDDEGCVYICPISYFLLGTDCCYGDPLSIERLLPTDLKLEHMEDTGSWYCDLKIKNLPSFLKKNMINAGFLQSDDFAESCQD